MLRLKIIFLISFLFLISCEKNTITVHKVPKQIIQVAQLSTSKTLIWTIPKYWNELSPSQFRIESYSIPNSIPNLDGDFSVTKFPDNAGSVLSNVNRWRSQLKLSPISDKDLSSFVTLIDAQALSIQVCYMSSNEKILDNKYKKSTFVGFFKYDQFTYFFKLTGESTLLNREKQKFINLLKSVRYENS